MRDALIAFRCVLLARAFNLNLKMVFPISMLSVLSENHCSELCFDDDFPSFHFHAIASCSTCIKHRYTHVGIIVNISYT